MIHFWPLPMSLLFSSLKMTMMLATLTTLMRYKSDTNNCCQWHDWLRHCFYYKLHIRFLRQWLVVMHKNTVPSLICVLFHYSMQTMKARGMHQCKSPKNFVRFERAQTIWVCVRLRFICPRREICGKSKQQKRDEKRGKKSQKSSAQSVVSILMAHSLSHLRPRNSICSFFVARLHCLLI